MKHKISRFNENLNEGTLWLVFFDSEGIHEHASVFYSELVRANTKEEAIEKYCERTGNTDDGYYDAIEKEIIE